MSRVERNALREAEKKRSTRLLRIRDCVIIFALLMMVLAFVSGLGVITPEPEYVFVGGTAKDVPVYLIGIPLDEEETGEKTENPGDSNEKTAKVGTIEKL